MLVTTVASANIASQDGVGRRHSRRLVDLKLCQLQGSQLGTQVQKADAAALPTMAMPLGLPSSRSAWAQLRPLNREFTPDVTWIEPRGAGTYPGLGVILRQPASNEAVKRPLWIGLQRPTRRLRLPHPQNAALEASRQGVIFALLYLCQAAR